MGYDMNWTTKDEAEEAAVAEATAEFNKRVQIRDKLPKDDSVDANNWRQLAQIVVEEAYEKMHAAEKSYFRCNIWGMQVFRTIMIRLGMVDYTFEHPAFPEDGWDEETGGPTTATEEVLKAFDGFDGRIALSKFGSNDGWLVTPEEIKNSLAQYDSFDDPKKAALAALPTDNKNPEEMVDFFAEFVEWMRGAVDHEGFRVY